MLIDLVNWVWIIVSVLLIGDAAGKMVLSRSKGIEKLSFDIMFVIGTCIITVYAETLSIFYRVGTLATLALAVICGISAVYARKEILSQLLTFRKWIKNENIWKKVLIFIAFAFFLALSCQQVWADDDYGYHIQAIEWINRYGIVKGQGILHFRFAYNSAFLSLQALYNWASLIGYNLHTVNSLYACLFTIYCILTINRKREEHKPSLKVSDVMKVFAVVYILINYSTLIGVETDPLPLMVYMYLFIKWTEYIEEKQLVEQFAIICLLSVFALTLKLSIGSMAVLTIYPLYKLLKQKQWKTIGICILCGILILAPFLVRNVIISGYLIYPFYKLDLFNVDWKIPESVVINDYNGIVIWGRGLKEYTEYDTWENIMKYPFLKWFPVWFVQLPVIYKIWFCFFAVCTIEFVIVLCLKAARKQKINLMEFTLGVALFCALYWFLNAPLIRYGACLMVIFSIMEISFYHRKINKVIIAGAALWGCVALAISLGIPIWPAAYEHSEMVGTQMPITYEDGKRVTLYAPKEGGHCDPDVFPGTNEQSHIDNLEMRGSRIEDGFRAKTE
ncbi:MAG: hypothetical protein LKF52_02040 [Butyrivibrio sp.]|nr:hypothetical protein [Butyrivibrio sp.]